MYSLFLLFLLFFSNKYLFFQLHMNKKWKQNQYPVMKQYYNLFTPFKNYWLKRFLYLQTHKITFYLCISFMKHRFDAHFLSRYFPIRWPLTIQKRYKHVIYQISQGIQLGFYNSTLLSFMLVMILLEDSYIQRRTVG